MSYLGIDVGTTGCKVVAFDEEGKIVASPIESILFITRRRAG